jgi:hypothetical protein
LISRATPGIEIRNSRKEIEKLTGTAYMSDHSAIGDRHDALATKAFLEPRLCMRSMKPGPKRIG